MHPNYPKLAALLLLATSAAHADLLQRTPGESRTLNETRPLEPGGSVEIINVAGNVNVQGWDQPQLEVTGSLGDKVERVDVTSADGRATVRVVLPLNSHWGGDTSAWLKVRVPRKTALNVSLVSADLDVTDISGESQLRTVSGNINGALAGDATVNTVSGDVQLKAAAARHLEVKSISGDVNLYGAGGSVAVSTVSGDAELSLGTLERGRFQTVSGSFGIGTTLAAAGDLDAESVSGDFIIHFAAAPDAAVDLRTFSGDIDNCFGPKPSSSDYGPGSRLAFSSGNGSGHVRVETKSGDITLCTRAPKASPR